MRDLANILPSLTAYSNPENITHLQRGEPLFSHVASSPRRSRFGNIGLSEIDMIGPLINPSTYNRNIMTQNSPAGSHMSIKSNYAGPIQGQLTPRLGLQDTTISSSTAGIRTPLTPSTTSSLERTPDLIFRPFATPANLLTSLPNQNQQNNSVSHNDIWSQPGLGFSSRVVYSPSNQQTIYPNSSVLNTSPPLIHYSTTEFTGPQQFYYGSSLTANSTMPSAYPTSPHSMGSEREPSLAPSTAHIQYSPSNPFDLSPSLDNSSESRRNSGLAREPPRDQDGNMICDHPKCAKKPPIFARKCEWK